MQELFALLLGEFNYGNARPAADDIRDFVRAYIGGDRLFFALPLGIELTYFLLHFVHLFDELLRLSIIFALCRLVFFELQSFKTFFKLLYFVGTL